jgi:hypothetical protein
VPQKLKSRVQMPPELLEKHGTAVVKMYPVILLVITKEGSPGSVAQWSSHQPADQKLAGSNPSQGVRC